MGETMKGRDTLMKKLLSAPNMQGVTTMTGNPVGSSLADGPYNIPSAVDDDGSCTRLSRFLQKLAKKCGKEINMVVMDHSYTRAPDWSPENIYMKPTRTLFSFNFSPAENLKQKDELDVDEIPERLIPPYSKEVTSRLINECEMYIRAIGHEDKGDDWEEKIDRSSWTNQQSRLFGKVVRILNQDRLSRLVIEGDPTRTVKLRVIMDATARRLRHLLATVRWEHQLVQWLHVVLLDHLSNAYLAAYLDALQVLRAKVPQLIERLLTATVRSVTTAPDTLNIVLKRPWDPILECLNENKPRRLPGSPIMLVVPSHPILGGSYSPRMRQWESYLSALGTVVTVVLKAGNETAKASLSTCLDQMVCAARMKTAQVRAEYPGKPIILVGWDAGSSIACQVALLEHVQAVVCMGFSVNTLEGKRGEPNDTLLDMRCPVFFVIGENSPTTRREELEEIRERMRVETGLVVVGGADHQLRMSSAIKFKAGVTQTMVDYCVMDEVAEFLGTMLIHPRPPLKPVPSQTDTAINTGMDNTKVEGKRKHSLSDSSSTPLKRPCTDAPQQAVNLATKSAAPVSGSSPKSTLSTLPTLVPVSGGANHKGGRQKSRLIGIQKSQESQENKWAQKMDSDQGTLSNGITVNIGSLGSLTPLGPIRLGQAQSASSQYKVQMPEPERSTAQRGRGSSSSLTIQSGVISSGGLVTPQESRPVGRPPGRSNLGLQGKHARAAMTSESQLTSLSSLLQGSAARLVVSSASSLLTGQTSTTPLTSMANQHMKAQTTNGPRVRTSSGRVVDLSKLTVLAPGSSSVTQANSKNVLGTTAGGNVVMLTNTSASGQGVRVGSQQMLVPVTGSQSFTVLPRQRSYNVVPKISVPSLKLSSDQQLGHVGGRFSGYTVSPTLSRGQHCKEELSAPVKSQDEDDDDNTLTPDKILELPIIFAKDDDNLFVDSKPETEVTETSTVLPITSSACEEPLTQKVTLGDTISFPLDDSDRERFMETNSYSPVGNMPNVYIIRSNRGRGRGGRRYVPKTQRLVQNINKAPQASQGQGIKYTKIILTNKNTPLKIGEPESNSRSKLSLKQGITHIDDDHIIEEVDTSDEILV